MEHDLPPFADTLEALESAKVFTYGLILDEEHSAIGEQAGVERTWVVEELGDGEAAGTCLYALHYMGQLVAEGVDLRSRVIVKTSTLSASVSRDDKPTIVLLSDTDVFN